MTKAVWLWSYLYWGVAWLLLGFLAAELAGYFRLAPWVTFSETVWHAETHPLVAPVVFATLLALIAHFLYHKPLWASVIFAVVVAASAHLLDKSWP